MIFLASGVLENGDFISVQNEGIDYTIQTRRRMLSAENSPVYVWRQ